MTVITHDHRRASKQLMRLASLPPHELELLLIRGETPDMQAWQGWLYKGLNIALLARWGGFQKFMKGFYRDGDSLFGYNVATRQNGMHGLWETLPVGRAPRKFGYFGVYRVDATSRDNAYLHAALLNYACAKNPRLSPLRVLRDYVVRVEPGADDLLLGKAFAALGSARIPLGFFLLERCESVATP